MYPTPVTIKISHEGRPFEMIVEGTIIPVTNTTDYLAVLEKYQHETVTVIRYNENNDVISKDIKYIVEANHLIPWNKTKFR